MLTFSFFNLKGGVAKTTGAVNTAYILGQHHKYRVLLIDNDMQGNSSEHYGVFDEDRPSITDILTVRDCDIHSVIRKTEYENIDVIPSNQSLIQSDRMILIDQKWRQQNRLEKALRAVKDEYDIVLIDNSADLSMSVINALVASDYIIVPMKIDKYTFEGAAQLLNQLEDIREHNERLQVAGGLVSFYDHTAVVRDGVQYLRDNADDRLPIFNTVIRSATVVNQSTFSNVPVCVHAPSSHPSQDYHAFVEELLSVLILAHDPAQTDFN